MRPRPVGNGTLTPRVPIWFAALMDSLQLRGGNTDALVSMSDSEWEELLEFSDPAHLTLPLAQADPKGFPSWVRDRLARNIEDNALRFDRVRDTYREAAAALNESGVEFLVVKGFTQSPAYVREPRHRMQSDIDIYCPDEQIDAARAALESIGYLPDCGGDKYKSADHLPTMKRDKFWKWRGNAFDPVMPLSIEVHFCLWNERVSMIDVPEIKEFWARRQIRKIEELSTQALHPVDHLGYFALHILRGAIGGDWIVHHVLEMATFLNSNARDAQFWDRWKEMHTREFRNLQAISFALAERWFSCMLHPAVRAQVNEMSPQVKAWVERCGGSLLERMFRQNRDWLWLHVALVDSRKCKVLVLRKAILPHTLLRIKDVPTVIDRRRTIRLSNRSLRYIYFVVRQGLSRVAVIPGFIWQGALLRISPWRALDQGM